jgi:hypothetical protein
LELGDRFRNDSEEEHEEGGRPEKSPTDQEERSKQDKHLGEEITNDNIIKENKGNFRKIIFRHGLVVLYDAVLGIFWCNDDFCCNIFSSKCIDMFK